MHSFDSESQRVKYQTKFCVLEGSSQFELSAKLRAVELQLKPQFQSKLLCLCFRSDYFHALQLRKQYISDFWTVCLRTVPQVQLASA